MRTCSIINNFKSNGHSARIVRDETQWANDLEEPTVSQFGVFYDSYISSTEGNSSSTDEAVFKFTYDREHRTTIALEESHCTLTHKKGKRVLQRLTALEFVDYWEVSDRSLILPEELGGGVAFETYMPIAVHLSEEFELFPDSLSQIKSKTVQYGIEVALDSEINGNFCIGHGDNIIIAISQEVVGRTGKFTPAQIAVRNIWGAEQDINGEPEIKSLEPFLSNIELQMIAQMQALIDPDGKRLLSPIVQEINYAQMNPNYESPASDFQSAQAFLANPMLTTQPRTPNLGRP